MHYGSASEVVPTPVQCSAFLETSVGSQVRRSIDEMLTQVWDYPLVWQCFLSAGSRRETWPAWFVSRNRRLGDFCLIIFRLSFQCACSPPCAVRCRRHHFQVRMGRSSSAAVDDSMRMIQQSFHGKSSDHTSLSSSFAVNNHVRHDVRTWSWKAVNFSCNCSHTSQVEQQLSTPSLSLHGDS